MAALSVAGRMVYSLEARRKMGVLLAHRPVDLAHVHNIYHQLSPSLLAPLHKRGIPVVMTVHDFKLVCPVYSLLSNGQICERCVGHGFSHAVRHRCNRGSLSGSMLVAGETWLHRRLRLYRDGIDLFITPSAFARDRMVTSGYPSDRIVVIPNCVVAAELRAVAPARATTACTWAGCRAKRASRCSCRRRSKPVRASSWSATGRCARTCRP